MASLNQHSHSFVIKVWIEETVEEAGETKWRAHITHVQSGKRCYFENLEDIQKFLRSYLISMSVSFGWRQRLGAWLHRS